MASIVLKLAVFLVERNFEKNLLCVASTEEFDPMQTSAGALAAGKPRDFIKAINSVQEFDGAVESVTDDETLEGQSRLARTEGIFEELAGVAPGEGLIKLVSAGVFDRNYRICFVATGNGLKDVKAPLKRALEHELIEPRLQSLRLRISGKLF